MRKILSFALAALVLLPVSTLFAEGVFDHQMHVEDAELACEACHSEQAGGLPHRALMPEGDVCLDCHDEDILAYLPEKPTSHAGDYEHFHQFDLRAANTDCALCHRESVACTFCHHGENVDFLSHDRNWLYNHALTGMKGTTECASCHETRSFCTDCHLQFGIQPGNHFAGGWSQGSGHGESAKQDLGSCLLCHDGPEPVCASCHGSLD